jgi:HK97 family phage major capsid protein
MHDTIMAAARKLDVANTNTVQFFTPSLIAGEPDRVLGKPIYINNDMASALTTGQKVILFGDFSKYKIRRILAPTVERNDNIYWDSLNVGFMGYQRLDAKYIASGSIKFLALA